MKSIDEKEKYTKKEISIIQKVHNQIRNYVFENKNELPIDDYFSDELCYAIIYAYNLGRENKPINFKLNKMDIKKILEKANEEDIVFIDKFMEKHKINIGYGNSYLLHQLLIEYREWILSNKGKTGSKGG